METQALVKLDVAVGDLMVEVIGSEVRFWRVTELKSPYLYKCTRVGTSLTVFGKRTLMRTAESMEAASDLTSARVYNRKDPAAGAALVRKYFPDCKRMHLYYAGCGPSGTSGSAGSHYSFEFGQGNNQ